MMNYSTQRIRLADLTLFPSNDVQTPEYGTFKMTQNTQTHFADFCKVIKDEIRTDGTYNNESVVNVDN